VYVNILLKKKCCYCFWHLDINFREILLPVWTCAMWATFKTKYMWLLVTGRYRIICGRTLCGCEGWYECGPHSTQNVRLLVTLVTAGKYCACLLQGDIASCVDMRYVDVKAGMSEDHICCAKLCLYLHVFLFNCCACLLQGNIASSVDVRYVDVKAGMSVKLIY
jgi:hypothetical protein